MIDQIVQKVTLQIDKKMKENITANNIKIKEILDSWDAKIQLRVEEIVNEILEKKGVKGFKEGG